MKHTQGSDGQSTNRQYKYTSPSASPVVSNGHRGVSKQEYSSNGSVQLGQLEGAQQKVGYSEGDETLPIYLIPPPLYVIVY